MALRKADIRDILMPLAVLSVVGTMVFPLPVWLLDVLLVCNITFAASLFISSIYLKEADQFTTLPTMLLLATLFRLSLNISTTRQLLATGSAPEIVEAFGQFVAHGNLVVGVVVFLIITLVQFIVIAKGSERIAEVSARFTLDALPGKQMAIDADLRAGILGLEEAKERRRELYRESKLYGALDGSMKFVKGDAVAGLLITLVNIVAGLTLGVTQQNLTFLEAASRYSIFTIGDGLVSQMPALLIAIAAGVVVTRIADKDSPFLGRDFANQLIPEAQAAFVTALVLLVMAFMPGLPFLPFSLMSLLLFYVSRQRKKSLEKVEEVPEESFSPKLFTGLVLALSPDATLQLQKEHELPAFIQKLRAEVFSQWGILLPELQFEVDYSLQGESFRLLFQGIDVGQFEREGQISETDGEGEVSLSQFVLMRVWNVLSEYRVACIDDTHTRKLFEVYQPLCEDLIQQISPEKITVTGITSILRELVQERISIREFPTILQSLSEHFLVREEGVLSIRPLLCSRRTVPPAIRKLIEQEKGFTARQDALADVREALKRTITTTLLTPKANNQRKKTIAVLVLSPQVDLVLSKASLAGVDCPIDFQEKLSVEVERLRAHLSHSEPQIVVASRYSRSMLAELVRNEENWLYVVTPHEITRDVSLSVSAEIALGSTSEESVDGNGREGDVNAVSGE